MNRTSAPTWLAVVGIVLAVIALWHPGTLVLAGVRYRLALNLPWWVLAMLAAASLSVLLAIVVLLIATPRRKRPAGSERKPPPPLRLSPLALTVLVLLLSSWAAAAMLVFHLIDPDLLAAWLAGTTDKTSLQSLIPDAAGGPDVIEVLPGVNLGFAVVLAILAAVLMGCALLVIFLNEPWAAIAGWFRHSKQKSRCLHDVAAAISAAAHELELGDDPRHAVIACYRRCEAELANQRRRRYNSETPREFVHDTLTALTLPENAVRSLLSLFERARFSDLPITPTDRSIAQDALTEIRSVLEGESRDGAHA